MAAGLLAAASVTAQPKLTSISPKMIQRGASIDVTLAGDRLGSVTGFVFSGAAGLQATFPEPAAAVASKVNVAIESDSGAFSVAPPAPAKADRSKSLVVRLVSATNAVLGARELRALGSNGISEPVTIDVEPLAEMAEVEPNNTIAQAQAINLPITINGTISAATEVDSFKFKAHQGETVVLDVDAAQSGSPLDSTLTVLDSAGRELGRSEDVNGFDSLLYFTAPATGEYVAQIRDFEYRGGGNFTYQLHAGVLPYVDRVFPLGGQRGKTIELSLTGHNLSGSDKVNLNIAPNAPLGRQELRLKLPSGFSNPIALDIEDLAETTENGTNGTNVVTVPSMVNGRIGTTNEVDSFKFKAEADQKVVVDVMARRLGSPLDALLQVYANGALLTQNDDAAGADARAEIDAKKGTEYLVAMRDLTQRGGPEFSYRIGLRIPQPAFAAKFHPDTPRIHRGGTTRIRCEVTRTGFDGPIEIAGENLPAGMLAEPLIIPAGTASGSLVLAASGATPLGTMPLKIKAKASPGGQMKTRTAVPLIVTDKSERSVREAFLTVLEEAPFSVEPVTLSATVDQEKATTLEFAVQRRGEFNGDVKVSLEGFSLGREPITKNIDVQPVTVKGMEKTAKFTLRAKVDSEIGTRHVFARAETVISGETVVQDSPPVPLSVTQIPFVIATITPKAFLTLPRPGSTNVEEVTVKFRADRRGFNGEIPLTLDGIPEGVTVADAKVPAGSGEAAIRLLPTEKAKPGTNYTFTAMGIATNNDRIYRHRSGGVKLFIEQPAAIVDVAVNTNAAVSAAGK